MGWSKSVVELPENAIVVSYRIVEPKNIYFWMIEDLDLQPNRANPMELFRDIQTKEPRAYKIEYDKELHKQLEAIKKQRKRGKQGQLRWTKAKQGNRELDENRPQSKRGQFEILNPSSLLPTKD
jgi:hypothetical protein